MTSSGPRRGATGDDLRHRLAAGDTVVMPGVWDGLTARLVREAGFPVAFLSGFCVAGARLGLPDLGLLTQTEMATAAREATSAAPGLALVVDGDTGYGNEWNTVRTVRLWEDAGAAGIFLEDQAWPKRCGHMAEKQVVPRHEWLAKLAAALDARDHLHVTARTDARGPLGLDEALARAEAAAALGVDAVFVEAPASVDELERIAAALPGVTLVANMVEGGRTPLLDAAELHQLGFRLVVSPLSLLLPAVDRMRDVLATLADTGTLRDRLDQVTPFASFTDLVDAPGWEALAGPKPDTGD